MKRGLSLFAAAALTLLLCGCGNAARVRLDEENSSFSDFTVNDGQVCITCTLAIENSAGGEVRVRIAASSPQDVAGGLLQSAELAGWDESLTSDVFTLREGKNSVAVVFVGVFGGTEVKQDRLIPEDIQIIIAE